MLYIKTSGCFMLLHPDVFNVKVGGYMCKLLDDSLLSKRFYCFGKGRRYCLSALLYISRLASAALFYSI